MRVAGVDGTKGGWVAVVLEAGRVAGDRLLPLVSRFDELDVDVIGIDIPIGFGPKRAADAAARDFLRGAASTVFSTPSREHLEGDYRPGLPLSAQSHALGKRILHVTDLAQRDPRLHEVHPEVSFRAMNDSQPLRYRKKSAGGAFERLELLRKHGIELSGLERGAGAPLDDVLDAAAAAWSAHRIASGKAQTLPDQPDVIDRRQEAIWY